MEIGWKLQESNRMGEIYVMCGMIPVTLTEVQRKGMGTTREISDAQIPFYIPFYIPFVRDAR
jgi:hypothetical protein